MSNLSYTKLYLYLETANAYGFSTTFTNDSSGATLIVDGSIIKAETVDELIDELADGFDSIEDAIEAIY